MTTKTRNVGILTFFVIVAGSAAYFVFHSLSANYVQPMPFDSALWKSARAGTAGNSTRLRMVDNLLENQTLEGMSKQDIVKLLGEPDETKAPQDFDMVYMLGQERRPNGVHSESLVFRLGDKEIVTEAKVITNTN
jgi:hypothetical protein